MGVNIDDFRCHCRSSYKCLARARHGRATPHQFAPCCIVLRC
ncbi:MAG: hypothetical protein DBW90_04365 [Halieaceae bacterium]|nr:MAG: hypothetical protein DBW90_04365 [Halieaceae bacterium]